MQNNINNKVWLVGAGNMAKEYAKVLIDQNISFSVIGRGEKSAKDFEENYKVPVFIGGLEKAIKQNEPTPESAIVTVNVEELLNSCLLLLEYGVKKIFVEKPAGLNSEEVKQIRDKANEQNAKVYIAYNRRFFASTLKAKELIEEDGGVTSFNFEFTEWSHVIEKLDKPKEVHEAWFIANSTHVVDLAFYLGGTPKVMTCYTTGTTDWYKKASNFSGAGMTDLGALFSYKANWKGPGRWGVEAITDKHKFILCPMEKLQIQNIGSVAVNEVEINDEVDVKYKPGLYLQTEVFFSENCDELLDINEHYERMLIFEHIENGTELK